MDFFNDIHIPKSLLFEECVFMPTEQAWIWKISEDQHLYMDINEKIRFRVEQEIFTQQLKTSDLGAEESSGIPPYSIIGSCQADGMGLLSWW